MGVACGGGPGGTARIAATSSAGLRGVRPQDLPVQEDVDTALLLGLLHSAVLRRVGRTHRLQHPIPPRAVHGQRQDVGHPRAKGERLDEPARGALGGFHRTQVAVVGDVELPRSGPAAHAVQGRAHAAYVGQDGGRVEVRLRRQSPQKTPTGL